ncbi:transcriptional regulator [Actibacterium mucosum KCTC 23349]|uniref:Transcriptional regulator n=1 Tax=Actibacterium mucosum KCTC 23349 TaxID=1454373 RepID=A0A037ZGL8_9RHOB|nr:winged helix-turn-helix transcriptional regulator [Actibacterium mucosum]KAJ54763.1 transcriptional regulator [Actibacterium mucosum KCTC 23349]
MYISHLVNLTTRSWALPLLAALHEGVPGRQAPLLKATGAGRTAFAQSLQHLIETGLLERNPGHGHPLRPEFRLTEQGVTAAALAAQVQGATAAQDRDLLRKAWTLPVLTQLHKPRQFTEIKQGLMTISDRALSQSLRGMEERRWITRTVEPLARPPRPVYTAVHTGAALAKITSTALRAA